VALTKASLIFFCSLLKVEKFRTFGKVKTSSTSTERVALAEGFPQDVDVEDPPIILGVLEGTTFVAADAILIAFIALVTFFFTLSA